MTGSGPQYNTPKENLRGIRVLFTALVIGVVLFILMAVVIYELNGPFAPEIKEYNRVFIGIAIALALVCLVIASQGYKKGIIAARNLTGPLNNKLNNYRSLLVRYLALCEGPALFGVIVFLMTGEFWVLVITAVMFMAMLSAAPTPKRVISDLNLDWKEQKELE